MNRRAFVSLPIAFAIGAPRIARATGGLDIGTAAGAQTIRVLLGPARTAVPEPLDLERFIFAGRTYRGSAVRTVLADGSDGIVNVLPIDAYLAGVLGHEVSASWPAAALEAQAIVARTYVLGRLRPTAAYDVIAAETDQRYAGLDGESVECREAVDRTSGTIVRFENRLARVAYSACCGGVTADAGETWTTAEPYLRSIVDPHCATAPIFSWTAELANEAVTPVLAAQFPELGDLQDVRCVGSTPTTRPYTVRFIGTNRTFDMPVNRFRNAFGASVVRSTFLRDVVFRPADRRVGVRGTGRGHGVGLCQWGARGFATTGATAAQIIAFYFPGTSLGRS